METQHIPVMLEEVMEGLNLKTGGNYIDCTLGGAGYALAIASRIGEHGKILAFDMDEEAISRARSRIERSGLKNITIENDNFRNISKGYGKVFSTPAGIDGIVFDLGLSSDQLEDPSRGFSFQLDAPIDMSFGKDGKKTEKILNEKNREELASIIREYGEERFAGRIAANILQERRKRRINTTGMLVDIISRSVPAFYKRQKQHFATRTFMALRIATNDELLNLRLALPSAAALLKKGGRLAAVSFHSLEDRIVKNFFRNESRDCLCPKESPICVCGHEKTLKIITKKPVTPGEKELSSNPRSRSAKLRIAEKI